LALGFSFSLFSCATPPRDLLSPETEKATRSFGANERIVVRAISQVLKDRGFGTAKVEKVGEDPSRLETDYLVQGDWRIKIEATVKKIDRQESEVTFLVTTEQKDSGPMGWKAKKLLEKEQYEKFFNAIEMQIYREWAKGQ